MIYVGLFLGGFLILLVMYVSIDNRFKKIKVRINQSVSGIDVALTRRFDVLTKLVDTTKQFMQHEKNLLSQIVKLRQGLKQMSIEEKSTFENEMSQVSSGINLTLENYPDLKSSSVVMDLQEAVVDSENDLYASRRMYNSNVAMYNEMIMMFPSSVIAKSKNYTKDLFFEAEEVKKEDVKINLI